MDISSSHPLSNPHPPLGRKPRPPLLVIPPPESSLASPQTSVSLPRATIQAAPPRRRGALVPPMSPLDLNDVISLSSCFGREVSRGRRETKKNEGKSRKNEKTKEKKRESRPKRAPLEFATGMWREIGQPSANNFWYSSRSGGCFDGRHDPLLQMDSECSILGMLLTPRDLSFSPNKERISDSAQVENNEGYRSRRAYRESCYLGYAGELTAAVSGAFLWLLTGDGSNSPTERSSVPESKGLRKRSSPVSVFSPYVSSGESAGASPTHLEL